MGWKYWLVDLPARITDAWFRAYHVLLTVVTMVTVTMVIVLLVLAALGVDVGW